ncbi:hypothetical protein ACNKHQ_21970 [Shigella flexneri]
MKVLPLGLLQAKGVTILENGTFVSGDNPLLNNLSSVHFTMKKMSVFSR